MRPPSHQSLALLPPASRPAQTPALDRPVIVLTAARSGSTLLRMILDTHPDLACPPETNVVKTCAQLAGLLAVLGPPGQGAVGQGDGAHLPDQVQAHLRGVIDAIYGDYLARRGKRRWCDKSLGTAPAAGLFAGLYPRARFICLYRHCMDVIDSGLEAAPWGPLGYGFEQFAATSAGNSVAALAAYWAAHTSWILAFETANTSRCLRVRYEQLVTDPERTAEEIFTFLGAPGVAEITRRCLGQAASEGPDPCGPGDHKIWATNAITADSVGRGARVPPDMIPTAQLRVVNNLLSELGYTPVDAAWRASAIPPALVAGEVRPAGTEPAAGRQHAFTDQVSHALLASLAAEVRARITAALTLAGPRADPASLAGHEPFALVAYRTGTSRSARGWRVDPHAGTVSEITDPGSGCVGASWLVTADVHTWLGILAGHLNMASSIRSGTLRYVALDSPDRQTWPGPDARAVETERRLAAVRQFLGLTPSHDDIPGPVFHLPGSWNTGHLDAAEEPE